MRVLHGFVSQLTSFQADVQDMILLDFGMILNNFRVVFVPQHVEVPFSPQWFFSCQAAVCKVGHPGVWRVFWQYRAGHRREQAQCL